MDDFFNEEVKESEPELKLVVTKEFEDAFRIVEDEDGHIFLTGEAGTGKSTWLKWFLKKTRKSCVVLAPTGIAAVNVGGQTIHSFFKWPPTPMLSSDLQFPDDPDIYRELDVLVIDEISMVRVDIMELIDEFMQMVRNDERPFGGAQVVLIGDLLQLPPVMRSNDNFSIVLLQTYGCEYFFAANVWTRADLKMIKFTQIFRQADPKFIEILNKIRNGTISYTELDILNINHYRSEDEEDAAFLCSRNEKVDKINADRISKLTSEEHMYSMIKRGNAWKNIASYIPENLTLKIGCKVMMLVNDSMGRFQNGTIGHVEAFADHEVLVSIYGNQYWVGRKKWESKKHRLTRDNKGDKKIETQVEGEVEQIPMKVAYAISVHKSQAQTFDSVIIDLGTGAFAPGMAYTAISRCRTMEKLFFAEPLRIRDLYFDRKVIAYLTTGKYVRA